MGNAAFRLLCAALACAVLAAAGARADSLPEPHPLYARYADPEAVVLAVTAGFAPPGGSVRLSVFDSEEAFLDRAAAKFEAIVGEDGVAVLSLANLAPGAYVFVAYYDANGDGRLNRGGMLGRPKEPFAFSNGVRPKLLRPRFDEAKVEVDRGAVVVIELED